MTLISVTARSGAPEETAADTRVVGLFEGESLADERLQRLVDLGEAKPGLKKVAVAHEDAPGGGQRRVLIAGLGKRDEFDAERARVAAAAAAARAKELGAVSLSWAAPEGDGVAAGLVEGTLLKLYSFDRFKSSENDDSGAVESLEVTGGDAAEVERARVAADAANAARDLQNLPSNFATPAFLAERAAEIADQYEALEVELFDREAIVAHGMGALAAVAQGTDEEPRLIVLRYRPAGRDRPPPRLRRQGGDLRHRRDLDQALGEDAGDEVRHVGRRRRDRGDGGDRAARAAGHADRRRARRPRTCRAARRSSPATSSPP